MEDVLHVQSITGIDMDLSIAGPGGRSYAFVVDWHIRILLALAWFVLGSLMVMGTVTWVGTGDASFNNFMLLVALPAMAIYFLYHPILEITMQGRTPGKRIAGIRIVTQSGEVPGVGAILIRNILRILDSLPMVYVVGLVSTILTRQSVRIGDMAAGTVLVYESDADKKTVAQLSTGAIASSGLDQIELAQELLSRWSDLAPDKRVELGRSLLSGLGRGAHHHEDDIFAELQDLVRGQ